MLLVLQRPTVSLPVTPRCSTDRGSREEGRHPGRGTPGKVYFVSLLTALQRLVLGIASQGRPGRAALRMQGSGQFKNPILQMNYGVPDPSSVWNPLGKS